MGPTLSHKSLAPVGVLFGTMNFFRHIRSNINVDPLLVELRDQDDAWHRDTSRQDKIEVQKDTNTIFIRGAVRRRDLNVNENQESRFTEVSKCFPRLIYLLSNFACEMQAELSRVTVVRLKPRSQVLRHIDSGSYYFIRDRYHLVVYSPAGSVLVSGNEWVRMRPGELWWFNNKQYHEAHNESDEWRVHVIFDLLPRAYRHLAVNPLPPIQHNWASSERPERSGS